MAVGCSIAFSDKPQNTFNTPKIIGHIISKIAAIANTAVINLPTITINKSQVSCNTKYKNINTVAEKIAVNQLLFKRLRASFLTAPDVSINSHP